jgi:hypothetical protein
MRLRFKPGEVAWTVLSGNLVYGFLVNAVKWDESGGICYNMDQTAFEEKYLFRTFEQAKTKAETNKKNEN